MALVGSWPHALTLIITLIGIVVVWTSKTHLENREDLPATLESSAFANDLYHELKPEFRSCPCFPKRIHLSQASNVAGKHRPTVNMTVSFSLDSKLCRDAVPTVLYGRGLVLEGKASAEPLQFDYTSAKTGEYYESDLIFHVTLTDLLGGSQRYWYRIQVDPHPSMKSTMSVSRQLKVASQHFTDKDVTAVTPTLSFATPPLPGAPTTIALIGDLGQTEDSTVTMAHMYRDTSPMKTDPISLVMFAGDLSYADGEPHRWVRWLDLMEPLFRSIPVHVAAGNHEIERDNRTQIPFTFYENLFRNPNRIGPAEIKPMLPEERNGLWHKDCTGLCEFKRHYNFGNSFYAVDHGLLHMITLSSFSDSSVGSVQYKWLEQHLPTIDRAVTPWVVVVFHAPLYTSFVGHVDEIEALTMKESMEPLFAKYKVNLVVSGHDHGYMRTHPLILGEVDDAGMAPIYLTVGAGGNREHHAPGYQHEEPEEWVAKRDRFEYGYGHLHVANSTHAHWRWVRDGYSREGLQDVVWLFNPHSAQ